MPRIVEFNGQKIEFADGMSDDQVAEVLQQKAQPAVVEPSAWDKVKKVAGETFDAVKGDAAVTAAGMLPGVGAALPLAKAIKSELPTGAEGEGTKLFSKEGLGSVVDSAAITLGQTANTLESELTRPEPFVGLLPREGNMKIRGLMDQGMSYAEARKIVRGEYESARNAEIAQHDAEAAGNRKGAELARQELPANPSEPLRHAQNIASSLSVTTPALVAGAATKNLPLALALGVAGEYPGQLDESLNDGSSRERAQVSAGLQSAIGAGLEIAPMGKLIENLGTAGIAKIVKDYVLMETGTEVATTAAQETIAKLIDRPDETWESFSKRLGQALYDTAVETPFAAALGGGLASSVGRSGRKDEVEEKIEELRKAQTPEEREVAKTELDTALEGLNAEVDMGEGALIPPTNREEADVLDPNREAMLLNPEPMSDEELMRFLDSLPSEAPAVPNDGTAVQGVDAALPVDLDAIEEDAQIGNTKKVRGNAEGYEDTINDATPASERKILFGAPEVRGQRLGDVKLGAGVVVVGEPTAAHSRDLLDATHDLYSRLAEAFAPEAKIILAPQTAGSRQAVGTTQRLASGEYVVVPAQARSLYRGDAKELTPDMFNPSTKAKILDNAAHEFGHVMMMERFGEGAQAAARIALEQEQRLGEISEATISGFPPLQQALLREYNQFRQDLKTKNAAWFQHEWMSPAMAMQRQLVKDMDGYMEMNAESFVKRLVTRGNPQADRLRAKLRTATTPEERKAITGKLDVLTARLTADYLSFDEFMAEKMARWAYDKDFGKGTKALEMLGGGRTHVAKEERIRNELLSTPNSMLETLRESLRKIFIALKKGIKLASGQTFRIKAGVTFDEWVASLSRTGQLLSPKAVGQEVVGTKDKQEATPVEKPLPEVSDSESVKAFRKTIARGKLSPTQKAELYKLIRENSLVSAQERMVEMLQGKVKMQLSTEEISANPFRDSVVKGRVFHGTTATFKEFSLDFLGEGFGTADWGDGFYFTDNPEAASEYAEGEGGNVHAVYLDIKKPATNKIMLSPKVQDAIDDGMGFTSVAEVLQELGYDGIEITHKGQGKEYVVFSPDQIKSVFDRGFQADPNAAKNGVKSSGFKAFFGDWESGNGSKVVAADGHPLITFHATQGDFSGFKFGDIGFHFGNLTAAHARMLKIDAKAAKDANAEIDARLEIKADLNKKDLLDEKKDLDWNIRPAYLNIRNPLKMTEDGNSQMWEEPRMMARVLVEQGVLTEQEFSHIAQMQKSFQKQFDLSDAALRTKQGTVMRYQMFQPLRAMLQAKGYDGIEYANFVEGGTTFVAFANSQIVPAQGNMGEASRKYMQLDVDKTKPFGFETDALAARLEKIRGMGLTSRALRQLARTQWYVLEMQQLAWIHPEFAFLDMANDAATRYTAVKSSLQVDGEAVAQQWKDLGKEWDARLSKALEAEAESGKHWTEMRDGVHTVTAGTLEQLAKFGIRPETAGGMATIEVYMKSKNVLTKQLNAAANVLARRLGQTVLDTKQFAIQLNDLKKTFKQIAETPFLPRGDYGEWGIVITKQDGKNRTVVHRQMFENNRDLVKAQKVLEAKLEPGHKLKVVTKIRDEQHPLLALPVEYVEKAAEALDLTAEQKEVLMDLMQPVKTERLLNPYAKALEKISGGSKARMRNFADFVWHNSTMIARTEAIPALRAAQKSAREMFNSVQEERMFSPRERIVLQEDIKRASLFMDKTIGYMLSPPNEWYGARSTVAIIYLWGSIKTALLNITGIITTMSSMVSQYGSLQGSAALAKAHKQLGQLLAKGETDPETTALYNRAIKEGFLIQNYAAHLAGAATAGVTRRLVNRSRWTNKVGNVIGKVADAGMVPFTLAEQYTRRVTFLAEVNALRAEAKARGEQGNPETIYTEAIKQTDLLQNSYTLANRPIIMRGGNVGGALTPLATIFLSFMVHFTFNASGGYTLGAKRRADAGLAEMPKGFVSHTQLMLVMLLLIGGYEALPGMENILDVLDAIMLKVYGKTARQMVREGIKEIPEVEGASWVNDPRWWGKGLGGDVWGFDVSGSLGIGRLIPGTSELASTPRTAGEVLGNVAPALFGVAGGLVKWAAQFAIDAGNGNDLSKNLQRFPGVIGAAASAKAWSEEGVRGTKGELLYEPSQKEVIGKALNFMPSAVSDIREENWAKHQAVDYWATQRSNLQRAYNRAKDADDREAIADTLSAVEEFNEKVLDAKMRLRIYDLNSNYRQHARDVRKLERGIVPKNVRNLTEEVGDSFAEEGEE